MSLSWGQRAEGMESQADTFELYFINHRMKIGLVNGVSRTSAKEGAPRIILPQSISLRDYLTDKAMVCLRPPC